MKFQDSSMRGSKVTGGIKKCDVRMYIYEYTYEQAKCNKPYQLFQSLGHNKCISMGILIKIVI